MAGIGGLPLGHPSRGAEGGLSRTSMRSTKLLPLQLYSLDTPSPSPYRSSMPLPPRPPWHPWLTLDLVLRRIPGERWANKLWREIRKATPTWLKYTDRVRRSDAFN